MSTEQPQVFDAAAFAGWVSGASQALPGTFRGVTQDSRKVTPGCLYVALRGERFDGHDFVAQALRGGAAAAMVGESWQAPAGAEAWPLLRVRDTRQALCDAARAWRLRSRALIVGLTGSSGKTTTKEMSAALFSAGGRVCATQGNLNNEIGLPLSLLALTADAAYGIFELGTSHPGEIARLADVLRPRAAIISSIGCAHIEAFGSVEAIAREKGALLRVLPADGFAVLCRETACFEQLAEASAAPVVTTSLLTGDADFSGRFLDPMNGTVCVLERETGVQTVLRSGLPGEHNASDLLLAFAAARTAGVPPQEAAQALLRLTLPGMRWEVSVRAGVMFVNDAYNANPQSMTAVLRTFMKLPCEGRRVVVLGDMLELGGHAEALHREVGRCVAELSPDALVAVGENGARYLAGEAVKAGLAASRVTCFADAAEASAASEGLFSPGDCVLLKASRGMRLERILNEWQV
ncbi:MAG: UDP-N-acetylmuramoyl-tripeptide--D-alanyl-D-alanine ligase [Kiritimatiellae bacterium]|nr:UDP-N-acetylmuramoyl-tripeptide--D-alanyl-D-alanine ligase [Kiritimatiellia bacterium]